VCETMLRVNAPVRVARHVVSAPGRCPTCGLKVLVRWASDLLNKCYGGGVRGCLRLRS